MPDAPTLAQKPREWLSTAELAGELGVATVTLKSWRARGEGPIYARIGRAIRYSRSAVTAWIAARTSTPVAT